MATKCSHEDSRLTCIECSSPICAQCLVQCPVGFRCKSCVGSVKNPLTSVTPLLVVKTLSLCIAIGCGAGWLIPFIAVPFFSCFIDFFLGLFIGRWLARVIDYKLGKNVAMTIVFGLLIGMAMSPCGLLPMLMVQILAEVFTGHGATLVEALTDAVGLIFGPVCFFAGILRPTIWGDRW